MKKSLKSRTLLGKGNETLDVKRAISDSILRRACYKRTTKRQLIVWLVVSAKFSYMEVIILNLP